MNRLGIRCLPQLLAACMAPMLACAPAYGSPLVFSENSSSNPWVLPAWTNLLASAMPTPATCADSQYGGSTSWSTLTDGSVGSTTPGSTIPYPSQMNTVVVPTNGKVVTFALDLSGTHSAGYDITAFDSYGLWDDPGREDQNYTLAYSTVSAPDTFTPITSVAYHTVNPGSGAKSTHIRLTDTAGYLALHVAQIRITFDTQENSGTGYSELVLTDSQQAITTLYESNSTNVWTLPSGTNLLDGATASPSSPLTNQGYGLSTTWTTLTDDSVGSATTASQGVAPANGSSVIFPLDISTNIKGYNLTSFDSYCAWQDSGRDNQDFAILYSTVAAPATFIPLTQVMNHTSSPVNTTHSRLTNNVTGFLATEVAALKFAFNNQENAWVGYREFIALGSAVPLSGTLTWAGLSGAAGSANWVTTADSNWMEGTSSSVYFSSDPLIFSSAGINSHINIPTALTAESLMFINDDTVPYIFSGQALTVTSDVTLSGSGTAVFGNALGAAGLTVSGTGSLTLAVNNTLTGTATVSSGTLNLASHGALGTASLTQTGGTVNFTSSAPVVSRLSGTGGTLVLGNPAEPGNTTLAVGDATTASYSGSIADASVSATGGLVKTGTGTLVLAGNNTYSGPTVINAGTLALPPSVTGINYFKVTGDSDSGITAINTYTHAINPSGSSETVNGIPFTGAGTGTLAADSLTAKTYVQAGGGTVTVTNSIGSSKFGDGAIGTNLGGWSGVTGNLLNLFSHFDLGGTPTRTVVLTGLAPNTWYDVRLYEKPWDTSSGRTFSVAYDVGNDGVVEYTSPPIDQNCGACGAGHHPAKRLGSVLHIQDRPGPDLDCADNRQHQLRQHVPFLRDQQPIGAGIFACQLGNLDCRRGDTRRVRQSRFRSRIRRIADGRRHRSFACHDQGRHEHQSRLTGTHPACYPDEFRRRHGQPGADHFPGCPDPQRRDHCQYRGQCPAGGWNLPTHLADQWQHFRHSEPRRHHRLWPDEWLEGLYSGQRWQGEPVGCIEHYHADSHPDPS